MMKERIYVVEGIHDESKLKALNPHIKTVSVGGSQLKKEVLNFMINYEDKFQFVLLFDPDYTGEHIRKKVASHLKKPVHIFVDRQKSISRNQKKLGVEHLSVEDLKKALEHEIVENQKEGKITLDLMYALGLTGQKHSKYKREQLTKKLNLSYSNTKTLIDRLNWIGITKEQIEEILNASS